MGKLFDIVLIQNARHTPLNFRKAVVIEEWKNGIIVNLIGMRGGRQNHPVRLLHNEYVVLQP